MLGLSTVQKQMDEQLPAICMSWGFLEFDEPYFLFNKSKNFIKLQFLIKD